MIAVGGDDFVAVAERHLHADDDGFLADVEVAEAADQAHAVKLAGLLLEASDQQHGAIGPQQLVPIARRVFASGQILPSRARSRTRLRAGGLAGGMSLAALSCLSRLCHLRRPRSGCRKNATTTSPPWRDPTSE